MTTLEQVNAWAKKSCPKWNKNKLSRRYYRAKYRNAAKEYWESPEGRRRQSSAALQTVDTYPWPYCDPNFADWEEDGSSEGYNLISDQSGCVVKYATSYCAWKVFELTGAWPQKTSNERLDAKRWQQFLAEAGYTEITKIPANANYSTAEVQKLLDASSHYIGIKPDEGEWGVVVWLEGVDPNYSPPRVYVSSYIDKKYRAWWDEAVSYTWVRIN